ncbi:MAG: hypothetical protein AB8B58_11055 [Roseobacter sp.]
MTAWNTCRLTMLAALVSGPLFAQTGQDVPRFAGTKSEASSSTVASDPPQTPDRLPSQGDRFLTPQALIGAAALEAAREEGRIFTNERRRLNQNTLPD